MSTLNFKIKSQTEKLSIVRDFITEAACNFGFDDESASNIALAVDEACTNIIKHAYENQPDHEIDISLRMNNQVFEIVVTHQGKLFDPRLFKSPDIKDYIAHPRRGGLGIRIMKLLMDDVEYKILPDKKCEVHLRKKLTSETLRSR